MCIAQYIEYSRVTLIFHRSKNEKRCKKDGAKFLTSERFFEARCGYRS